MDPSPKNVNGEADVTNCLFRTFLKRANFMSWFSGLLSQARWSCNCPFVHDVLLSSLSCISNRLSILSRRLW